jgi:hypothetical protein
MAAKFVSSNSDTKYASAASCKAITADDWKRKSVCASGAKYDKRHGYMNVVATHLKVLCNLTDKTLEGEFADE